MRSAGTRPRQATQPVKRGFSGPKSEMAHARMDAVGADQQIGLDRSAVLEARDDPLALRLQADQPVADMQPFGGHGSAQKLGKVAAMEVIVGRAECRFDLGPERRALQGAAVVPAPLMDGAPAARPTRSIAGFSPRRISSREALGLIWMPAPISPMRGACS